MLDRAGDAERDVELRRDGLAGLADLRRVRVPAGVDDRTRRADRAAERLRELLGEREVLGRAETAAAGDDDVRVLDRGAARLLELLVDDPGAARVLGELDGDLDDLRRAAARCSRVEGAGAEEREPRLRTPADVDVDRVLEGGPLADEGAVPALEIGRASCRERVYVLV